MRAIVPSLFVVFAAVLSAAPVQRARSVVPLPSDAPYAVCFAPGTDQRYVDEVNAQVEALKGPAAFRASDSSRWSRTATDGSGLSRGDPMTLTWAVVPDGTPTGQSTTSNLRAMLNRIYGNQATWIAHFQSMFDRWGDLTGIRYVLETADDKAAMPYSSGALGVRADIRIGGHTIDGNSGVLAFNYYPNSGDMFIDTADSFYNSTSGNSLRLRNVTAHEHGHGLGMSHVCPIDRTKLMEPYASTSFDGPQHDDILAGQRLYGDRFEGDDTAATATDMGRHGPGTITVADVSIDGSGDDDFFAIDVSHTLVATVTVTPVGRQYSEGAQGNSGCGQGQATDSRDNLDLSVALIDGDGSTVIASADATGRAGTERLSEVTLQDDSGPYYVRVSGAGTDDVQLYELRVDLAGEVGVPGAVADTVEVDEDGSVTTDVMANDTGLEDGPIALAIIDAPQSGSALVTGDRRVRYTPDPDFAGEDRYSYRVRDTEGEESTTVVTVSVRPINDPPVVRDDSARVMQGVGARIAVLANDRDVDGDELSIAIDQAPTSGVASVPGDGTVHYQPGLGADADLDTFTISVSDGHGAPVTSTVYVEVLPNWRAGDARVDTDGDHFPDDLERSLSTDPSRFTSCPSSDPPGTLPGVLDIDRLVLRLRRGDDPKDEIKLRGTFELPEGVVPEDLVASVYIGGLTTTLAAGHKSGESGRDLLRVRVKKARRSRKNDPPRGRFDLRLRQGDFEPLWEDEELALRPKRGARKRAVTIYLMVEGRAFEATVRVVGRTGQGGRHTNWRSR